MSDKRILIADDHSAIRSGVQLILNNSFKNIEFGVATQAQEVMDLLDKSLWDILILDINLPGRNGFDILKSIKDAKNPVKVLVFSMHQEEQVAIRALKLGAYGYLSKDAADKELVTAITKLLAGKKYITPTVSELMVMQLENPMDKAAHELLSDREYQTILLMASGKTVSQIAAELSLSVATISTYRARILEKMGMKNNAQLTRYVLEHNLL